MQLIELAALRHRVSVGVPLPFNVRQVDRTLLLAQGQVVESATQLEALFERGMLVDIDEVRTPRERVLQAPAEQLPAIWAQSIDRVGQALNALPSEGFDAVLDDVAAPLVALVERDADLAIFQVLRQHGSHLAQYGVNHSTHCAIAAFLTSHRLGWEAPAIQRAFKAALTMNVSMLELQGQLATQSAPLSPAQRSAIEAHPQRSVQMLQQAGICDADWLQAIAEHHESSDGSGYPAGLRTVTPLAALLRQCDIYTAKLSPRLSREALTADVAARRLFAANPADPVSASLIKEFGIYPPGTFVRLASGETCVVVRRGASAHTPVVAALTDERGVARSNPRQIDTARPGHVIAQALGTSAAGVQLSTEQLMGLLGAA